MNSQFSPSQEEPLLLLNRDHIIAVSEIAAELTVTTTAGKFIFGGEPHSIAEFRDLLVNDIQSNLVAVPARLRKRIEEPAIPQ
jgi:hypothetical protein